MDITPLNSFFEQNGYASMCIVKTMGSTLVFVAGYIVLWPGLAVLMVVSRVVKR